MDDQEFKNLKQKLNDYIPLIPNTVIESIMGKCGFEHADDDVKKLISLMSHKFLTDVALNAFQFHKINVKANIKDKRFSKEKKITLRVSDLESALDEMGIDISRPHYYD